MEVVSVEISTLHTDPKNARKHNVKNLKAIKGSLEKFGQQKPIVVNEARMIIAGNGTFEAAKALGWKDINVVFSKLSKRDERAFALADNRTAELAEWDDGFLDEALKELASFEFDLGSIGFDESFIKKNTTSEPNENNDKVPDVPKNVHKVKRGQVWQLGAHRLMCGDSTSEADVAKLMDGKKADMVFTDPPYGIDLNGDVSRVFSGEKHAKKWDKIKGDSCFFEIKQVLSNFDYCAEQFIWGANFLGLIGNYIVWDKVCQRYDGRPCVSDFELCWSKQKHQQKIFYHEWVGWNGKDATDDGDRVHPTQKPVALCEWFFDRWGKKTKIVVDLFLGSGSTLIACEKTKRTCFGMELDEHYCSVIIQRWMDFTGQTASVI